MFSHLGKYRIEDSEVYAEDGRLYLSLKYHIDTDDQLIEVILPKVNLGIQTVGCPSIYANLGLDCRNYIKCGDNEYDILPGIGHDGANHVYYTEKILKQKTKKMTVAEIEEKLGYKIEIVSEDGK